MIPLERDHVKSLTDLWWVLAQECASRCCTSAKQDYKKLLFRVEHEGMSFLTITLPSFEKDLLIALEEGFCGDNLFLSFKRKGGLPLFLGGFLRRIFDASGVILDKPCIDSIRSIRQLCCLFGKVELPCTPHREFLAMERYIQCERELADVDVSEELLSKFSSAASVLFSDVFSEMDRLIYNDELVPKHGPGAVADHLKGNLKYDLTYWPQRLERVFPYGEYALSSWRYKYRQNRVQFAEPEEELPVKVISVLKDAKTPRIIAVEPACMQYMQQALMQPLVHLLQSEHIGINQHANLCEGFIGFDDQDPNRALARQGSIDHRLATLDLSEASDRVLSSHVSRLVGNHRFFREALFATRSEKAKVQLGHQEIILKLEKFASMGSALCFPIEAMVFLTICVIAIADEQMTPVNRRFVESLRGKVRVYGDDIIVPIDSVRRVTEYLTAFGLKVNTRKSFWKGSFRESCGGDFYDGEWVTPIRCRRLLPQSRADVSEVVSLVSFRNQLYMSGYWSSARVLDEWISRLIRFPLIHSTSPLLGRWSFLPVQAERLHPRYQSPLVKGYVIRSRPPRSVASGEGSLLKCLLPGRLTPFEDVRHLERQGRPLVVDIKLTWAPPV